MSANQVDDSSAPLVEHLIELRDRIVRCLIAFILAMILAYLVWNPIFNFLTQPVCSALAERGQACTLYLLKLQEGFFVAVRISVLGGFIIAFPYIATQLWRFVAPGLYKTEKAAFLPFLIASPVMFFAGAALAFYMIIPYAYVFFLGFQQVGAVDPVGATGADTGGGALDALSNAGVAFQGSVSEYLDLTIKFIMAFGLTFQMPVLLTLMGRAGLVSSAALVVGRRYAILIIVVLAALVTPPDMMSQLILFAAVYPLYEVSILLIRRIEKVREAQMKADGVWVEPEDDAE